MLPHPESRVLEPTLTPLDGSAPILASSLYFELLWKHERVHCSIVHGKEIKYFSEYSNLLCRCRAARCLRRDRCHFAIFGRRLHLVEVSMVILKGFSSSAERKAKIFILTTCSWLMSPLIVDISEVDWSRSKG